MTIFYGGTEDRVREQLVCQHDWHRPCIDEVGRYYKCRHCFCVERDCTAETYYRVREGDQSPPQADDDQQAVLEREYTLGNKRAYLDILLICLRNLGIENPTEAERLGWVVERQGAIEKLRDLCADFGDNAWPDDLNLADVIEKHLGRSLWQSSG